MKSGQPDIYEYSREGTCLARRPRLPPVLSLRRSAGPSHFVGCRERHRRIEMKSRILQAMIAAFATVLATGEAQAATCAVPSVAHPTIQSAVNDPSCDPINVAPGIYPENVMINRSLTLNGAQAGNPVAGRVFAVGESTITGTGGPADITILAANVTIDGFSLTNPGQSFGIRVRTAGDNAVIVNNIIDTVGAATLAANPAAIYLELGPDGVDVVGNRIADVKSVP